jgi:hypothetical protein
MSARRVAIRGWIHQIASRGEWWRWFIWRWTPGHGDNTTLEDDQIPLYWFLWSKFWPTLAHWVRLSQWRSLFCSLVMQKERLKWRTESRNGTQTEADKWKLSFNFIQYKSDGRNIVKSSKEKRHAWWGISSGWWAPCMGSQLLVEDNCNQVSLQLHLPKAHFGQKACLIQRG